jgi:chromosome segregation ATPase
MKYITKLITLLSFLIICTEVSGQEKMTMEEWHKQISEYTSLKFELASKIIKLQKDKSELQTTLDEKNSELKKIEEEYWLIVGGKEIYDAFNKKLDQLYKICKNKEGKFEDAEKMFMELDTNLKCHPDFASKYKEIKICLDNAKYREK